jgi:hypothetical protein
MNEYTLKLPSFVQEGTELTIIVINESIAAHRLLTYERRIFETWYELLIIPFIEDDQVLSLKDLQLIAYECGIRHDDVRI